MSKNTNTNSSLDYTKVYIRCCKLNYIIFFFCRDSDKTVLGKLVSTNVILACHYDW